MTRVFRLKKLSLGVLLLIGAAVSSYAQEPNAKASDEAAIRENVRLMQEGWNAKSGAVFAKAFAGDADYVVINGMQIKGKEKIGSGHDEIFATIFKDSVLSLSVKQLRFLRDDVAVVHVSGHHKIGQGPTARESDAVMTMVMTKENGKWTIAAFQNTQVATHK